MNARTPLGLAFGAGTGVDGIPIKGSSRDLEKQLPGGTGAGRGGPSLGGGAAGLENRVGPGRLGRGQAMADALRERTARLLTDYLEYCAREPGTPARAPSTPEAAVLRSVAAQVQQRHEHFLSDYRGYGGNRVELVAQVEREILAHPQPLSWGRVVALLTFAGTLLERSPTGTYSNLGPDQELELGEREAGVRQDCRHLVDFLCNRLTGQHRAWLEAHDGWVSARVAGSGAGQPGTRPRGQHRERPRGFKPVRCSFQRDEDFRR